MLLLGKDELRAVFYITIGALIGTLCVHGIHVLTR